MTDLLTFFMYAISIAVFGFSGAVALLKKPPHALSFLLLVALEIALLVQLVFTIVSVSQGHSSKGDIFEFFGYIFFALLVPPIGALWGWSDKSRTGSLVFAVAGFTVLVMVLRMSIIWFGN